MDTVGKSSILSKTKSGWLAVLSLIVFTAILLIVDEAVHSFDKGGITAYILFGLLSAAACYLIIKQNPKSIWYVPLIMNSLLILSAIIEPNFWKQPPDTPGIPMWVPVCGGWVLSIILSIIAAIKGREGAIT